jgi:hypothetical protein
MTAIASEINGLVAAPILFFLLYTFTQSKAFSAISRAQARKACPMEAMQPVWQFFNRLEGFEFAASR